MRFKKGTAAVLIVLVLALGAVLGIGIREYHQTRRLAEALFEKGDYLAAMSLYAQLGDEENAALSLEYHREQQYLGARRSMEAGEYLRAKDILLAQRHYKDSENLILACDYLRAGQLTAQGKLEEAKALYETLEDYPGAEERLRELVPLLYEQANALADAFRLDDACRIFAQLGDYRDSAQLLRRAEAERAYTDLWDRVCDPAKIFRDTDSYAVYRNDLAYVLVPKETDRETRFFLYYPGGRNEELYIDYFLYYTMDPAPNTVALFLRKNGVPNIEQKNTEAIAMLEQTAAECGIFLREMIVGGSSLGAYPALHSVLYTYYNYGIRVPVAFCLDAGNDWNQADLMLSWSQFESMAGTGVALYLFDNPWVGMDRDAIYAMVATGNDVTMVDCYFDDHERMTLDAMGMGVVNWLLGDRSEPIHPEIYNFRHLSLDA